MRDFSIGETESKSQKLLRRLESHSIVPSNDVLEMEDVAESHLKYILGNFLTDEDLQQVKKLINHEEPKEELPEFDEEEIIKRFSKFTLMPNPLSDENKMRASALETIIQEEKLRSSMDLAKRSSKVRHSCMLSHADPLLQQTRSAFKQIKDRLDNIKRFCPSIYYCQDDVITVWGNLVENSQNLFTVQRND